MARGKFRDSRWAYLFNLHDHRAQGRSMMLTCSILENIIGWLTGGLFYTSFLMINGIDIVNVGIISFIPAIASCFSIFAPSILERLPRRRWFLGLCRGLYYALSILAVTVMPTLVQDTSLRVVCFVVLMLAANIINAVTSSGYMVWHVNFLPNEVRSEFYSVQQMATNFLGIGVAFLSSIIADALAGSAYQETILYIIRYVAFGFAMISTVLLMLPKEYPYEKGETTVRLRDVFTKPVRHPKFGPTMLVAFLYTFFGAIPSSALNYYLLNDIGISYTFYYIINMAYPFIVLVCMRPTKRFLDRYGWFKAYAITEFAHLPTNLLYAFVSATTYTWAFPLVRLVQHVLGLPLNICRSNMPYANLPKEDQTNYMAFYTVTTSAANLFGMMLGTWFVAAFPALHFTLLGVDFVNVQVLVLASAAGNLIVPLLVHKWMDRLTPDL